MLQPEIRIKYARLLDPHFKDLFEYRKELGKNGPDVEYPSLDFIIEKVDSFIALWPSRAPVLGYMQEVLELTFYPSIIDVYVVGGMKGAVSTPILLGSKNSPSDFLDILTHEILHVLLSDNNQKIDLTAILPSMYPDETPRCRIHIIVHAMMKKIYLEFLKEPERLQANIEHDKNFSDYSRAWTIVDEEGYENIIERFKLSYK